MKTAILVSTTGPRHSAVVGSVERWNLHLEFLDPPWGPCHDAQDCSELSPRQINQGGIYVQADKDQGKFLGMSCARARSWVILVGPFQL